MRAALRGLVVLVLLAPPSLAAAERVITRSGAIYEGKARFEGDFLIVRGADGSEVRIPRTEVLRVELTPEEQQTPLPEAPPEETPPPQAPPPPQFVPPKPPKLRSSAALSGGVALAAGYHRGYSLGLEWQRPLRHSVTVGLGGQAGVELVSPHGELFTWGFNARFYLGMSNRFVADVGYGLNLARVVPCQGSGCPNYIRNLGPELSAGFQHMSHAGLFIEALGGIAFATEPRIRADRTVSPTFQLSAGYLFH